jgi:hypothetical protein
MEYPLQRQPVGHQLILIHGVPVLRPQQIPDLVQELIQLQFLILIVVQQQQQQSLHNQQHRYLLLPPFHRLAVLVAAMERPMQLLQEALRLIPTYGLQAGAQLQMPLD